MSALYCTKVTAHTPEISSHSRIILNIQNLYAFKPSDTMAMRAYESKHPIKHIPCLMRLRGCFQHV